MLFNSTEFLLLFVATYVVYWALAPIGSWRIQKLVLLLASLLFYMSWSAPFVLLLFGMVTVAYVTGLAVAATADERGRKRRVGIGVGLCLAILAYFKYRGFFVEILVALSPDLQRGLGEIVLPLGISFYTFHAISYMVDVHRGAVVAHRNFLDVALYLAFFPQLIAGPITRASQFLPQLAAPRRPTADLVERALMLIALGFFKKVVCADVLGEYVDGVFRTLDGQRGLNLLLAAYVYAFQIYFDFSGYSDMAIGIAALFGFELPINFRLPYVARDPSDFWRRWHISLSSWLRDYLYVPLGGNRRGRVRTYVNLTVTMLLGGLWHGPAWTYVLWGGYHGALLAAHRWWTSDRPPPVDEGRAGLFVRRLVMFHLVTIGWVIFRARTLSDVPTFFTGLWRPGLQTGPLFWRALIWTTLAFVVHHVVAERPFARRFLALPPIVQAASYVAVAVLVFVFSPVTQRFIYFQF
ncbi:MAG: MBOAT family protein [Candidatus Binatia bacterium]